jgi:hypothetical protein
MLILILSLTTITLLAQDPLTVFAKRSQETKASSSSTTTAIPDDTKSNPSPPKTELASPDGTEVVQAKAKSTEKSAPISSSPSSAADCAKKNPMSTGCLSESAPSTSIPDPTTTTVAACPNNQHLNDQGNCVPDKVTTTTICSTGSKPDDNGKCPADVNINNDNPTSTTTITCPSGQHLNKLSKCIPDKECPDGSIPIKGKKCPPLQQQQQQPTQPQQPSVVDCKLHPDELTCPQLKKPTQPHRPDDDCLFNTSLNKCNPDQNGNCPSEFSLNGKEQCIPDKACPSGFTRHNDDETGTCYPVTKEEQQQPPPPQPQPQPQQQATSVVVIKQPVIVKTKVETTVKNFITNNIFSSSGTTTTNTGTFTTQRQQQQHNQPTSLLLLDSAQICQLAGDLQCVSQQNLFKTLNLVTYPDSSGKYWIITGQAENVDVLRKALANVQLVAHFYDSKGNNIGGLQQVDVTPGTLKTLQTGVFNIKANTSNMNGTPAFMRLEFLTSSS